MQLYDTATGAIRELVLPPVVSLYVCGITPYDTTHLGHAFTYHAFDVLTRRLRSLGHQVRSIRNVTDVDDDIFRVARERRVDPHRLVDDEVARFEADLRALDLLEVTAAPRASAAVGEMVRWIARLVATGRAYAAEGWVYFDAAHSSGYGELSGLTRDQMIELSRERGANPDDPRKRDPLDFVLWQPSQPGEDHWPSAWSEGRPGWHIECSVMAALHLGPTIDIHGGGEDLVYPHHSSEIAQSEAYHAEPFARHWMHTSMVAHHGIKMSKSLGNLVFVNTLLRRHPAATVRLLLAQHHYRTGWGYSDDDLAAAEARRRAYLDGFRSGGTLPVGELREFRTGFCERIDDDLDTPGALAVLDRLVVAINHSGRVAPRGHADGTALLAELLDLLGCASAVRQPAAAETA